MKKPNAQKREWQGYEPGTGVVIRIIGGDCREVLPTMADESVHCVVTSPPYWGLRDYGTAKWESDDLDCDHLEVRPQGRSGRETPGGRGGTFPHSERAYKTACGKCGAVRIDSQIGLEPTFAEYVETMRAVFAEVRRMLRKDGTLWLNLGDSYCSGGRSTWRSGASENKGQDVLNDMSRPAQPDGLKPKDLIGIPWRVAFALQADGWYLRQDIIWSKPNPMPESVTDRCTKAHEYLFLLAKSERYYYDADAIAETLVCKPHAPGNMKLDASRNDHDRMQNVWGANGTRNRRSVWEVASAPFSEAHFATFPPALIEPCILAGCPKQCCAKCGAPWVREVKREGGTYAARKVQGVGGPYNGKPEEYQTCGSSRSITVGWSPSCSCSAAAVPGTVLDPFGGAGTTGLVADRLGRNAVLIELNPQYADMAEFRVRDDAPLFVETSRALAS